MDQKPTNPIEQLLHTWHERLREHDDGLKHARRIGLLALSALLTYLGFDTADLFDQES